MWFLNYSFDSLNNDSTCPFALRKVIVDLSDDIPNSQYSVLFYYSSTAFKTTVAGSIFFSSVLKSWHSFFPPSCNHSSPSDFYITFMYHTWSLWSQTEFLKYVRFWDFLSQNPRMTSNLSKNKSPPMASKLSKSKSKYL